MAVTRIIGSWLLAVAVCVPLSWPWAAAAAEPLAPRGIDRDFFVTLPKKARPIPEPLPDGCTAPGFRIRGTKGWNWTPQQYLAEIPTLARCRMNFLMNCYLSMFDRRSAAWNSGKANRWWEPLPESKRKAYEEVVRACRRHDIQFCFAMNPNLLSLRPLDYDNDKDLDDLWRHYAWMQTLGVRWFSICLDDISQGIDAKGQARVVNEVLRRLRAKDTEAQMVFCPTYYWATGDEPKANAYLKDLAEHLHRDVYVFWTGPGVVGPTIPRQAAEAYKRRVKHPLIIWDNYPVNDGNTTLHLGPVTGRAADLCEVADGYMSNPLCPQNEINRIPLLTMADYAYNPAGYDPARSIGQAIVHLAQTPQQRQVLKELVELYPGMILTSQGTGWNPVLERFDAIVGTPHSRYVAELYLRHVEDVADRLSRCFPDRFSAAKKTLIANITTMKAAYAGKYSRVKQAPGS